MVSPGDSLVVAGTKTCQQHRIEFGGCGDLRGLDGSVGLAQHLARFTCPGMLGGVQVENTLQVAEKMGNALLNPCGVEHVTNFV